MSSRSNNQRTHGARKLRRQELYNASLVPSVHHRRIEDYFQFNVSAVHTVTPGQLAWNADDGTVDLGMDGGNVTLQLGLETLFYVRADSTICAGQVVMATGTIGNSGKLKGAPANITDPSLGIYIIGIAAEQINTNDWGFVSNFGTLREINTSGSESSETWSAGTILFYKPGSDGRLTSILPTAPSPHVLMAMVTDAGTANGSLFIRLTHGLPFGYINGNVEFSTLANNDFIVYDAVDGRWENQSLSAVKSVMGIPSDLTWYSGSGDPEGVVTATVGCLYSNIDDSATDTLFVKKSGIGDTGWIALG